MKIPILPLLFVALAALLVACGCPPGVTTGAGAEGGSGGGAASSSASGGHVSTSTAVSSSNAVTSSVGTGATCNPNPTPNPGCPPPPCQAVFRCAPHTPPCTAGPNNQCYAPDGVQCGEATVGECAGCCP